MFRRLCLLLVLATPLSACRKAPDSGPAPHQIHIVGSSAAYPFSTAAAERFMREQTDAVAPLTQADGTAAGIARFCAGVGAAFPDLLAAARAMTGAERATCAKHGIAHLAEIPFGWSALVLVTRPDTLAPALTTLSLDEAMMGPGKMWPAGDRSPTALPIALHGPTLPGDLDALAHHTPIRVDGRYHPHGADPELVVKAVLAAPGAIGIIPWATAVRHADTLRRLPLDGVMPSADTIASGRYPARLPLILYLKPDEVLAVPGLGTLLADYADGWSASGDFLSRGLIPLDPAARDDATRRIAAIAHR